MIYANPKGLKGLGTSEGLRQINPEHHLLHLCFTKAKITITYEKVSLPKKTMSGFEVAGIALAVFPILVEGVQTIEHWRRYRVKLQDYTDIIGTQGVYYQDTLEELLSGIVQSEDEVTDFIAQPRGAIWSIPQYEEKLRQRLGRSYEVYMRLLENMVKALFSMCEKLGIDSSGKVGTLFHVLCQRR